MFVGRNLLCKVTDFGFFSNNCHLCVEIFILDIRIQKWQLLFDSTKTYIFFDFFSCYEKRLHSPFLPLHRQNKDSESRRHITKLACVFCWDYSLSCVKEVWVSGLNQHTANVPNRKVPKVRILLLPHFGSLAQLDQSTTLRTSVSGVRVSHESQHWRFGRVGLLHRSWKPADGNVSKVRIL